MAHLNGRGQIYSLENFGKPHLGQAIGQEFPGQGEDLSRGRRGPDEGLAEFLDLVRGQVRQIIQGDVFSGRRRIRPELPGRLAIFAPGLRDRKNQDQQGRQDQESSQEPHLRHPPKP